METPRWSDKSGLKRDGRPEASRQHTNATAPSRFPNASPPDHAPDARVARAIPHVAWEDSHGRLWQGDVRACLAAMEPESVQCVVTSPPYHGLRSYGTAPQIWGGSPACDHMLIDTPGLPPMTGGSGPASAKQVTNAGSQVGNAFVEHRHYWDNRHAAAVAQGLEGKTIGGMVNPDRHMTTATCTRCGCWRGELGSEPLHDCAGWATGVKCGACFICHLVEVFEGVRRVLRNDGICIVNLGDSYAGSGKGPTGYNGIGDQERRQGFSTSKGARIGSVNGESGHTSGVAPPRGVVGYRLRSDLTPEQRAYVLAELAKADATSAATHSGRV